ncbi:uncharacterized protein [Drosophila kikkawai]|uniref:Uncharacterized protein n=1 Tax=Drosophila kikkawai TaxID=30033 RepID=A0A6P4I202_DROKI|nr:uncharacterized protein LOC108071675 [Drosophila kikkawai]
MCFNFKLFGGRRRRAIAANGGISPRPSLANGPQVSIDTVHTVKSSKSAKSVRLGKASAGIRPAAVIVGKKMGHSANLLGLEKRQHTAAESGGGATSSSTTAPAAITAVASVGSSAGPAAVSEVNDNGNSIKRSSWWGFFGMGKKKRNSNQSI